MGALFLLLAKQSMVAAARQIKSVAAGKAKPAKDETIFLTSPFLSGLLPESINHNGARFSYIYQGNQYSSSGEPSYSRESNLWQIDIKGNHNTRHACGKFKSKHSKTKLGHWSGALQGDTGVLSSSASQLPWSESFPLTCDAQSYIQAKHPYKHIYKLESTNSYQKYLLHERTL